MFQNIHTFYQFISSLKIIHSTYKTLSIINFKSLIQLKIARINVKHPHFSHSSSCFLCTLCTSETVHQANVRFSQYSNAYRRTCTLLPCECVHVRHANVYTFVIQTLPLSLQKICFFSHPQLMHFPYKKKCTFCNHKQSVQHITH